MLKALLAALAVAVLSMPAFAADKGSVLPPSLIPSFDESPSPMTVWNGFYVEAGFGLNVSELDVGAVGGGTLATLGDSSWGGHFGFGYDKMVSPNLLLGVLARVELGDVSHALAGTEIGESDLAYMVGGRFGWVPREDAMLYLLAGYKWSDLDLSAAAGGGSADRNGWVIGGGIEIMLSEHWGLGSEYAATLFEDDAVTGISLEETDHAAKLRLLYKF